tara:strand:+ start:456 stop:680 length:225 start_codon:yes stop_codon:yes gene_type:complete
MKEYNGHKSWNQWNVSLWLSNDYSLYTYAIHLMEIYSFNKAVDVLFAGLKGTKTPDGARYNKLSIRNALKGLSE